MTIDHQSTVLPDERMIHSWCGRHLHFEDAVVARSERARSAEDTVMRTMRQIPGMPLCMLKQTRPRLQAQQHAEAILPDVRTHSEGGMREGTYCRVESIHEALMSPAGESH